MGVRRQDKIPSVIQEPTEGGHSHKKCCVHHESFYQVTDNNQGLSKYTVLHDDWEQEDHNTEEQGNTTRIK